MSTTPDLTALKYDALTRQLERMRAMQYAYFAKFFHWLTLTAGLFLVIFLLPFPPAQALLPFLIITAGVQASFFLHFVDFARVHARALEQKINQLLGEDLLIGGKLEDDYFYPLEKPKFAGVVLTKLTTFFSAFTLHWFGLWTLLFVLSVLRAWEDLANFRLAYGVLLGSWSSVNVGYLAWYFIAQRDEKQEATTLRHMLKIDADR